MYPNMWYVVVDELVLIFLLSIYVVMSIRFKYFRFSGQIMTCIKENRFLKTKKSFGLPFGNQLQDPQRALIT
jgi:hypothetical protein